MASYNAKSRDPLIDHSIQAAIERRSKELLGIAIMVVGAGLAFVLRTYAPGSTAATPGHALGQMGRAVAGPVFMILGYSAWVIPATFLAWGARFMFHWGSERVLNRIMFTPIAIALAAVFAATHVPGAAWQNSFGLGGLFGDTMLGAVLNFMPFSLETGLKIVALGMGAITLALTLFVLGVDMEELRATARFAFISIVLSYGYAMNALGTGGRKAAAALRTRREARAAQTQAAQTVQAAKPAPLVTRAEAPTPKPETQNQTPGFLARFQTKPPAPQQPELVEPTPVDTPITPPEEERIRERISGAIKARMRPAARVAAAAKMQHQAPPQQSAPQAARAPTRAPLIAGIRTVPAQPAPQAAPTPAPFTITQRKVVQPQVTPPPKPSQKAMAEAQPSLFPEPRPYDGPPLSLLSDVEPKTRLTLSDEALEENARMLENVLEDYGVRGEIVSVRPGPVVTMYELEPAPGLKASRVIGLADDIARSMSALSARVSTVPGRSVIGIELPNAEREKVMLREILSHRDFGDGKHSLPLALGKDIGGAPMVTNLAKMPHLLIAGTTGSGKSVAINTMILSLLYKLSPEDCRMIMIDPKMLELSVYDGIPHLLSPVVTDPKKAVVALKWVVGEMEERYRKMSKMGVRNITGYNGRVAEAQAKGEMFSRTVQTGFDDETGDPVFETEEFTPQKLPFIVVIVDEMADLMMVAGKEIEACIQRLAQMARASGIHLIMATQRPSVDVITGTIKANFPTRISFQVTSKIDSRTILGEMGAEQLLGMGDMLYMAGGGKITRCHGPFVSDEEVEEIVNALKAYGPPDYVGNVLDGPDDDKEADIDAVLGLGGNTDGEDALYDQAVAIVIKDRKCSTSYIQRKLAIGYNKAARLVEQMEDAGLVSPANHVGKREILIPEQE
jgi:S-DNA-T family DNA segregation ATPase FtsK/SpoIIIE